MVFKDSIDKNNGFFIKIRVINRGFELKMGFFNKKWFF